MSNTNTNTTNVQLNLNQIDYLRSILFEYYQTNTYQCDQEFDLHNQLEIILAKSSDTLFQE